MSTNTSLPRIVLPEDWTSAEIAAWREIGQRFAGQKIVAATGVFDLFHEEHQKFLDKAKAAGDVLIVGIETDERVRRSKGPGRPVQDQATRVAQVSAHPSVDAAVLLPTAFNKPVHHRAWLALVQPSILAVSSHSPFQEAKAALIQEIGGQLQVVHQHNPAVSTTRLVERSALQ